MDGKSCQIYGLRENQDLRVQQAYSRYPLWNCHLYKESFGQCNFANEAAQHVNAYIILFRMFRKKMFCFFNVVLSRKQKLCQNKVVCKMRARSIHHLKKYIMT